MERVPVSELTCLTLVVIILQLVGMHAEAFSLVPDNLPLFLVPSQVLANQPKMLRPGSAAHALTACKQEEQTNVETSKPTNRNKRRSKTKKKKKKKKKKEKRANESIQRIPDASNSTTAVTSTIASSSTSPSFPEAGGDSKQHLIYPTSGNVPDVLWRSVPMEHLRQHPNFVPLLPPHCIKRLDCLEDVKLFRQESWQWDALHRGRCTTSQAVAALGFLEPLAGETLGVPRNWRRGGVGAFHRMRQPAIRTLDRMNQLLCSQEDDASQDPPPEQQPLWLRRNGFDGECFQYEYLHQLTDAEMRRRKTSARKIFQNHVSVASVRMMWGNAQEATALLTALNFFSERDPGFLMKETGMCGAGLDLNQNDTSLLVGATPDAILCHSNGTMEALEVKNHCPFMVPWISKGKRRHDHQFVASCIPFDDDVKLFSHYVPQLMMEMLCLGPACRSVVMVRQTAKNGALILRLHRDEQWIEEMLHFLQRFQREFVDKDKQPPSNFFWVEGHGNKEEVKRYRRFINRTLEIRSKIEVIGMVPHEKIQRISQPAPMFLD